MKITKSARRFNTMTAASPAQVKRWLAENEHHAGAALTKDKRGDPKPGESYYLRLTGANGSLLIPNPVQMNCRLAPSDYDKTKRLFEWDDNTKTLNEELEEEKRKADVPSNND